MVRLFRVLFYAGLVLLGGCANLQPEVISSSPPTVSVQSFQGRAAAKKLADTKCQQYGRHARWISGDVTYIFNCVD